MHIEEGQPAQAAGKDDLLFVRQRGVGEENEIGLPQLVRVAGEKLRETRAADLLLPFDEKPAPPPRCWS